MNRHKPCSFYRPKSFATRTHEELRQKEKRNKEIIEDGQAFYYVMMIAIGRVWKDRTLRIPPEPHDFINATAEEMARIFGEAGDYKQMCMDELGIELNVV